MSSPQSPVWSTCRQEAYLHAPLRSTWQVGYFTYVMKSVFASLLNSLLMEDFYSSLTFRILWDTKLIEELKTRRWQTTQVSMSGTLKGVMWTSRNFSWIGWIISDLLLQKVRCLYLLLGDLKDLYEPPSDLQWAWVSCSLWLVRGSNS